MTPLEKAVRRFIADVNGELAEDIVARAKGEVIGGFYGEIGWGDIVELARAVVDPSNL